MKHKKSILASIFVVICVLVIFFYPITERKVDTEHNQKIGANFEIIGTISFYQEGKLIKRYSGLDPYTDFGLSCTFAKATGDSYYNLTTYNRNMTSVSLGNATTSTVNSSSIILPNEWIRVLGVVHAQAYNGYNLTATFSGLSGTNYTNCMGVNLTPNLGYCDLIGYMTFPQYSYSGSNQTIQCEIQIQGTTT